MDGCCVLPAWPSSDPRAAGRLGRAKIASKLLYLAQRSRMSRQEVDKAITLRLQSSSVTIWCRTGARVRFHAGEMSARQRLAQAACGWDEPLPVRGGGTAARSRAFPRAVGPRAAGAPILCQSGRGAAKGGWEGTAAAPGGGVGWGGVDGRRGAGRLGPPEARGVRTPSAPVTWDPLPMADDRWYKLALQL